MERNGAPRWQKVAKMEERIRGTRAAARQAA